MKLDELVEEAENKVVSGTKVSEAARYVAWDSMSLTDSDIPNLLVDNPYLIYEAALKPEVGHIQVVDYIRSALERHLLRRLDPKTYGTPYVY